MNNETNTIIEDSDEQTLTLLSENAENQNTFVIDLKSIEFSLNIILEQFPELHLQTQTVSDEYEEQRNPLYPKRIDKNTACRIQNVCNAIVRNLSRLTLCLDDFKNDKDIPYLLQNLKDHVKLIHDNVFISGASMFSQEQLRENYYQIQFKIIRIIALIEYLNDKKMLSVSEFDELTGDFNDKFIEILKGIYKNIYGRKKKKKKWVEENTERFYLGRGISKDFLLYLFKVVKNIMIYYFAIRSSDYSTKEVVINSIYKTYLTVQELRSSVNFEYGFVFRYLRDFMNLYSKFESSLRELVGYLEVFFTKEITFSHAPIENHCIELYIEKTCKLCELMFKNHIFEYIQECAEDLKKGLLLIDSTKEDTTYKAMRNFFDVPFVPTIKYPNIENNYSIYNIYVFKDKTDEENPKQAIETSKREINDYLFGAYSYISPKNTGTTRTTKTIRSRLGKENIKPKKNVEKLLKKLEKIKKIYNESPELSYNKFDFAEKLSVPYPTASHWVEKLVKKGLLILDDSLGKTRKKYYKIDLQKINDEINNLKN